MPQRAIAEALAVWREAERLLEQLPEDHPERSVIQFEVVRARAVYRRLTEAESVSRGLVDESLSTMQEAWKTLNNARQRLGESG